MLNPPIVLADLPVAYQTYRWHKKHALYGYPADEYPHFHWIASLEQRFGWLRQHIADSSGPYLFREMIQWGGSQNGVLQKVDDGAAEVCFADIMQRVVGALPNPASAIDAALNIPGVGLTYASKLLRFLDPENYGALDSRIRAGLAERQWTDAAGIAITIADNQGAAMINGYCMYLRELNQLRVDLHGNHIDCPPSALNPTGRWRLADVELALFQYL
jgi:hypothetical protein